MQTFLGSNANGKKLPDHVSWQYRYSQQFAERVWQTTYSNSECISLCEADLAGPTIDPIRGQDAAGSPPLPQED
jgi:hypothetical protein